MLQLRVLTNEKYYSDFESLFQHSVTGVYKSIDDCVTRSFDVYIANLPSNEAAKQVLDQCQFDLLRSRSIDCSYRFTEEIFLFVTDVTKRDERSRQIITNSIRKACDPSKSNS